VPYLWTARVAQSVAPHSTFWRHHFREEHDVCGAQFLRCKHLSSVLGDSGAPPSSVVASAGQLLAVCRFSFMMALLAFHGGTQQFGQQTRKSGLSSSTQVVLDASSVTCVVKQRCALNLLKGLTNELMIPVVAVGTEDALHAIQTDAQVASRFDPLHLARWSESDAFRNFIVTFGKQLLHPPSMDGPQLDFSPLPLACLTRDWHNQGKSAMLKGEKCRNDRKTTIVVIGKKNLNPGWSMTMSPGRRNKCILLSHGQSRPAATNTVSNATRSRFIM
jgi:hypothetical protein